MRHEVVWGGQSGRRHPWRPGEAAKVSQGKCNRSWYLKDNGVHWTGREEVPPGRGNGECRGSQCKGPGCSALGLACDFWKSQEMTSDRPLGNSVQGLWLPRVANEQSGAVLELVSTVGDFQVNTLQLYGIWSNNSLFEFSIFPLFIFIFVFS